MKILVTGSHGMVGSQLVTYLKSRDHQVMRLSRSAGGPDQIVWDPSLGEIDESRLEGFDAVVHLAGDNIADGRWTDSKKARILSSRVEGTTLLCKTLASLQAPPEVIVSASAIGYYGDRGEEVLTEESGPGAGFLADVCSKWEAATESAGSRNIRVARVRMGVVLSPTGGAMTKLLTPFKLGAGGRLGSGKQYMSWIALDDLVQIFEHVITHKGLVGPVNAVAPNPVTNQEFTEALGAALHRPTVMPLPGFAAHLIMGEMADELLLSSARVMPNKLMASGYKFIHPDIQSTLRQMFSAA
ncbi:MAG TPA: TIGR01777 family oxidoreductase [Chroococcales cyanobacterium]